MLKEHLSQKHDLASRRYKIIDKHVEWIGNRFLANKSSRILDLCCGPGLYTFRLAKMGYDCVGIDYSPESIKYAMEQEKNEDVSIEYIHDDIRQAAFGSDFDLAMLIYGELNVFRREDMEHILKKVHGALKPSGRVIVECHTYECVRKRGLEWATWQSFKSGLFSEKPHLLMQEAFWEKKSNTSTVRYFVIDSQTGVVTRYASTMQAYNDDEYKRLFEECGFDKIKMYPSLTGREEDKQEGLIVLVAGK